jgi:hypothetical protein
VISEFFFIPKVTRKMNKLKDAEELLNDIMVNVFDHAMQQLNCVDILN